MNLATKENALIRAIALVILFVIGRSIVGCAGSPTSPVTSPKVRFLLQTVPLGDFPATSYNIVYSFKNGSDGASPEAPLIDVSGTLYSTTFGGGQFSGGTVFSVTPGGVETTLYSFGTNANDGAAPLSGLLYDNGVLWGTTFYGIDSQLLCGVVFSVTTVGVETIKHRFKGPDGCHPYASLNRSGSLLYGVTAVGGMDGDGTIFHVTRHGRETVDYSFTGEPDGFDPGSTLAVVSGTFYGTTTSGGTQNLGTVFSFTPNSGVNIIHSFGVGSDGASPDSGLLNINGILYGTTENGGAHGEGTLYTITTGGVENIIYNFGTASTDGATPVGNLIALNGKLYGTTTAGGVNGVGTIFSATKTGHEAVLHSFGSIAGDGTNPIAGLLNVNGTLFGTTERGGTNDYGTVYSIIP